MSLSPSPRPNSAAALPASGNLPGALGVAGAPTRGGLRGFVASLLVIGLVGCPKSTEPVAAGDAGVAGSSDAHVSETTSDAGDTAQNVDLDGDGKDEIVNHYRTSAGGKALVEKEVDLNRDGKMDMRSYYDGEGRLEKEEIDGDYDGKYDWTDHYQNGERVTSEYDTDNDGKPNVFRYYLKDDKGNVYLDRKERDVDGDGKIDVWERFDAAGKVIVSGRDLDGDGKMDERIE